MEQQRAICHVDMDAFFAAIEQRDNPQYRGRPVVVGADPKEGSGRGVVATCSYEARRYGIRSAQPISEAYRRCPEAVFLRGRMDVYVEVSHQVRRVLEEFTPDMEPVSIDEAFLDVTGTLHLFGAKLQLARAIRERIEARTGLTASLGIAPGKMVAKIASDLKKPRGIVIVEPGEVEAFLRPLPVARLWGVGEKTRQALRDLGVRTIGDLARRDREDLARRFGTQGEHLWKLARGIDRRPVQASDEVKSVGNEHTFDQDTGDARLIATTLMRLCEKVAHRLRERALCGRTVTTKVRFEDFTTLTRATTLERGLDSAPEIYRVAVANMERADVGERKLRLLGVSVSGLARGGPQQTSLFDLAPDHRRQQDRRHRLGEAIDTIKERFGHDALRRGTSLPRKEGDPESHD